MKAIVQDRYGDTSTLKMIDVSIPETRSSEIQVKIKAVNISSADMRINTLDVPFGLTLVIRILFGWKRPRSIRGITASGIITKVGQEVSKYKVGDKVYFIQSLKAGCLAEYKTLNEKDIIAKIPPNMSYEEAAPLAFGAMSSYHFINEHTVSKGDKVLIYGASGSLGTYAIQLAKYFGATVTAVSSSKNHAILSSLGADYVIDYKINNFWEDEQTYDLIFDAVGKLKKKQVSKVLSQKGKYTSSRRPTKEDVRILQKINELVSEQKLKTYIEQVYDFEDFKQAHEHVYSKHKVGNVVISFKKRINQ
uniref:NADPH:quinone reductase n=1 Tax=Firmicutes bacterium enrichment culture clone fosmid MGS-M1 TaxID=1549348 RepID=A0A0B5KQE9_9FIRM|nr:NADPH:quinone reductase [Firmicutes bacterium enrichment culture clone fosmid MGS-M1]